MKKRLISLLLVVVMLVGMIPALGITVSAETTDPMDEGMTFTAADQHVIPYALDVGKNKTGTEAITFEARYIYQRTSLVRETSFSVRIEPVELTIWRSK